MSNSNFRTWVELLSPAGTRPHGTAARRLSSAVLITVLLSASLSSAAQPAVHPSGAVSPAVPPAVLRAAPAGGWSWPLLPGPAVVRLFEPPARRWLAGHRGVDLAGTAGDAVRSPAAGTVRFAGTVVDRGVLTLDHGNGTVSSFEPVTATVSVGDQVTVGQPVGLLASRSASPGAGPDSRQPHCPDSCLHWGVRLDGEYVDPLRFVMDRRPSVLLPLAGGPDG